MKLEIFSVLVPIAIFLVSANSEACDKEHDPCGKHTGWNDYEAVRLRVQQGASVNDYFMQSSRENGDLQVDVDISDPKSPQNGTVLMVEGRTFAGKGLTLTKGSEIDAIDGPLLAVILTEKVLSRAVPDGPGAVTKKLQIAHKDKETGIQFATPSAQGFIPPPWSVDGVVSPNVDGSVDFSLTLKWKNKNAKNVSQTMAVNLSGQLKRNANFHIPDTMSLDGWVVFGVGPIVAKSDNNTIYDYGAQQAKSAPKSIADIRKAIAIENSPGVPDPSLKLAGFWKVKCSDTFGLRIKPADQTGMYTVTFCGPGGCGDEQNERKTFITGDTHYHVVSSTELQVGRPDDRSTYVKCSDKMLP